MFYSNYLAEEHGMLLFTNKRKLLPLKPDEKLLVNIVNSRLCFFLSNMSDQSQKIKSNTLEIVTFCFSFSKAKNIGEHNA